MIPGCVSQPLRQLKFRLNDSNWSSPKARAEGLKRLALAQLGSAGALDDKAFVRRVVDLTIRRVVPIGLRAAAKNNPKFATELEKAAIRCETEGTRQSCLNAAAAAAAKKRDEILSEYAEWVVQILIDMKAPGCQWLYLAPLTAEGE